MQIKNLTKSKIENRSHIQKEMNSKTKVDINILLNKVKIEKKKCNQKKFYNHIWCIRNCRYYRIDCYSLVQT